jgi:hypothetical protein
MACSPNRTESGCTDDFAARRHQQLEKHRTAYRDHNPINDETVARPDNSHTDFWRELPLIGKAIVKFHGFAAPRRIPAHHFIHISVIEAFEKIAGYVPHALTHTGETLTKEAVKAHVIRWGIRDDGTLE